MNANIINIENCEILINYNYACNEEKIIVILVIDSDQENQEEKSLEFNIIKLITNSMQ